jgi:hypothetical protein
MSSKCFDRSTGAIVSGVGLDVHPDHAQLLEGVLEQQQL